MLQAPHNNQYHTISSILLCKWSYNLVVIRKIFIFSIISYIGVCLSDITSDNENPLRDSLPDKHEQGRGRQCDCRRRGLKKGQRGNGRGATSDGEEHDGPNGKRMGPPRPSGQGEGLEKDGARMGPPRPGGQKDGPREGREAGPREGKGVSYELCNISREDCVATRVL